MHDPPSPPKLSPYAAFQVPEFRRFLLGNLLALLGSQMQTTAIGWEIYQRNHRYLDLGLVGLAQIVPVVLLTLPAGHIVDRFDRRRVISVALIGIVLTSLALAAISYWQADTRLMYCCLVLVGVARAFQQPAKSAFIPTLVPREIFPNAVTWSTSGFQLATIVGPALAGILLWLTEAAVIVYILDAVAAAFFIAMLLSIPPRLPRVSTEALSFRSLLAGAAYVWRTKLLLGALSLDMFAVLFGGATSLLPVYARDILDNSGASSPFGHGPELLGWLRAAPGIGALITSVIVAHLPPFRRAGRTLLLAVAGFGVATIVFGFSRNVWLAWTMLLLTGGLDMVSVIIRHTLVQVSTPDSMRGRVSSVNGMFISISNELGGFESALVAQISQPLGGASDLTFGPTVSVVSGGIGTLLVVLLSAFQFPSLRRLGRLDSLRPEEGTPGQQPS